jgi:predicted metalloprotease with PDZ domain
MQWSIALPNIHRLKRVTANVKKLAERAVDWSEDTELLGSLGIVETADKVWRFTAIQERDELFNRLVPLEKQRWESGAHRGSLQV